MNEWMNSKWWDGILASLTAGAPIQQVHDNPHRHLDCVVGWMVDEHIHPSGGRIGGRGSGGGRWACVSLFFFYTRASTKCCNMEGVFVVDVTTIFELNVDYWCLYMNNNNMWCPISREDSQRSFESDCGLEGGILKYGTWCIWIPVAICSWYKLLCRGWKDQITNLSVHVSVWGGIPTISHLERLILLDVVFESHRKVCKLIYRLLEKSPLCVHFWKGCVHTIGKSMSLVRMGPTPPPKLFKVRPKLRRQRDQIIPNSAFLWQNQGGDVL